MKLHRNFLICVLAVAAVLLCLLAMPQTAHAASESDLTFKLNSTRDGYIVSDCDSSATGALVIPATYNGKPVTGIGQNAFSDCTSLTSIVIPNSVTSIGYAVFSYCYSLTSVTIPDSVTSIGNYAFCGCTGLTSITIPDSVTSIGSYAFEDCTSLTSVTIGNGVTSISYGAFSGCTGLTSVTLPDSVTSIGERAFYVCTGLTSITIPDSVTSIGGSAFSSCSSLTSITIPDSVTSIDDRVFAWCESLTSITIPDSVTSIGEDAFYRCTGLTSITIPDSVTSIGENAFCGCTGLTSVTIGNSVTTIGSFAFYDCTGLTSVTIGDSVTTIGSSAFRGCTNLAQLTVAQENPVYHSSGNCIIKTDSKTLVLGCKGSQIPADGSVASIDSYAFAGCTNLTSVIIPDSVTGIGSYAFYDCAGLTSVSIGDSVTSIGEYAFRGCTGLVSIQVKEGNPVYHSAGNCLIKTAIKMLIAGCNTSQIPADGSVSSIGSYAFYNCTGLTSITIPDSVTSIGYEAFYGCTGLTSVTIGNGVTSIGSSAFSGCTGLTSITIPDSVTSVGGSAFSGCSKLESITIPFVGNGGKYPFGYIFGESSYTGGVATKQHSSSNYVYTYYIPSSLKEVTVTGGNIPAYAFESCSNLTSITLPASVTSIGDYAFYECSSLTSITIPDSVTGIGEWAFYGCTGLTSVTIGNGVTSIGSSAFRHCDKLTSITIPASVTSIGERVINACENLSSLQVAEGNTIYHSAGNCIIKTGSKTLVAGCKTSRIPTDGSVKTIGAFAFYGCKSLTEIVLPESITTISGSAFCHCTQLTDISITDSVTSIGDSAFNNCTKLTTVIYCGTQEQWNSLSISSNNNALTNAALRFHNYENGVCTVCGHKNEDVSLPQTVTTSVAVSGDTAYRRDTITVTMSATAVERCNSGGFVFDFDTSAFEYVSGKALVSGFQSAGVSTENGRIAGYFMGNEATVQGDLFQITLRVKDGASFTEYTISGTSSFGVKTNGVTENISGANNDAEVTVVCNHSFGDWIAVDEIWRKHICTICSYEETAYAEYTVTFQYADGTVISSTQYRYGDAVVVPDAPPAQHHNYIFTGWDKEITAVCNGDCVYTAVFVAYILGDMDGDGIVAHEDAIYLLLNVMFGDEFYPLSNAPADMNDNGIVDANDAVYLLLHILFGEAFYPLDKG